MNAALVVVLAGMTLGQHRGPPLRKPPPRPPAARPAPASRPPVAPPAMGRPVPRPGVTPLAANMPGGGPPIMVPVPVPVEVPNQGAELYQRDDRRLVGARPKRPPPKNLREAAEQTAESPLGGMGSVLWKGVEFL